MYWTDIYPTHAHAARAERLGELGKVKLTAEQKAAIRAAKADAKIKTAQMKAQSKIDRLARREKLRDAKLQTRLDRQSAFQARSAAKSKAFASQGAQADSDAQTFAANAALLQSESGASAPSFAQGSGGGGGFSAPVPLDSTGAESAVAPDAGIFGIPTPIAIGGALVLVFLLMRR